MSEIVRKIIDNKIKEDEEHRTVQQIYSTKWEYESSRLLVDKILYVIKYIDYYYWDDNKIYKLSEIGFGNQSFISKYFCFGCLKYNKYYVDVNVKKFIEQHNVDVSNIKIYYNNLKHVSKLILFINKIDKCMCIKLK